MKLFQTFLMASVAFGLAGAAFADNARPQKNWGTSGGSGGASTVTHYELGVIAGQTAEAEKGLLGSSTYITNTSCGVCITNEIHGNGNVVTNTGTNSGDVSAQQGVGNGGISQGIKQ